MTAIVEMKRRNGAGAEGRLPKIGGAGSSCFKLTMGDDDYSPRRRSISAVPDRRSMLGAAEEWLAQAGRGVANGSSRRGKLSPEGAGVNPRQQRYPLNHKMVSQKRPEEVLRELTRALERAGIEHWRSDTDLTIVCQVDDLRFDAEVVKIPRLKGLHGVHFRRIRGDATEYSDMCASLIRTINI